MTKPIPYDEMLRAFAARDASYDGLFFYAVRTTGIFCRPSCASRPKAGNVEFFPSVSEAMTGGYRACKRCAPLATRGEPPAWVAEVMRRAEAPDARMTSADLEALGVSPERARRWFAEHYGMTFAAWCRGRRLSDAFTQIRDGAPLDDVILSHGYESHSGFREAFGRTFGQPPGTKRDAGRIVTGMIESPLGSIVAATTEEGICMVDFADRRMIEANYETMRRTFGCAVVPGAHPHLERLRGELGEYFAGKRRSFGVPVVVRGTAFQECVWNELRGIAHGETISYDELAVRVGNRRAVRAVARANATNRVCILIPCHRVIAKDGTLSGYGGGVWRKRLLLAVEREGKMPGLE